MPARGRELERPPRALLPAHVGEIRHEHRRGAVDGEHRIRLELAAEIRDRIREVAYRHRLDARQRRLRRRLRRAEQPLQPHPPRALGDREHAADRAKPSVERELADGRVPLELVARHLPRRGEHGERDRQVEAGALLPQLRRREVDGDAAARELELGGRDPAADSLARLVQRLVGEPDDRERGHAVLDVRLHLDTARLETDERMGDRACEHTSTLRGRDFTEP